MKKGIWFRIKSIDKSYWIGTSKLSPEEDQYCDDGIENFPFNEIN